MRWFVFFGRAGITGRLHQSLRGPLDLLRMAVAVVGEPHKTARSVFGQMVFADHEPDRPAPRLWG